MGGASDAGRRSRRRVGRRVAALAVLLALVWGAFNGVSVLVASQRDDRAKVDAIVVLGAAQYDGWPSPVLRGRLDHARALYRSGVARRIVLTGSKAPGDRFTEAFSGYRYLTSRGVPGRDLTIVDDGTSTWESLRATQRVLQRAGVGSVVLVSDPYHSRRLLDIAAEVGMSANVSPTASVSAWQKMARETALVSAGRVVGYRRLLKLKPS
ncbi:MAG: YdcF family protein [Actinomycetes bacterium]